MPEPSVSSTAIYQLRVVICGVSPLVKAEEAVEENCRHRPVQYLNNVLEQDHWAIKRRVRASQHFRSFSCTASFSVYSLRKAKFPIIYADLRLDCKVATHPKKSNIAMIISRSLHGGSHRKAQS